MANVVSSLISESGGLSMSDDTQPGVMNLVNSLVSVDAQNSNIQRSTLKFQGSSLLEFCPIPMHSLARAAQVFSKPPIPFGCRPLQTRVRQICRACSAALVCSPVASPSSWRMSVAAPAPMSPCQEAPIPIPMGP